VPVPKGRHALKRLYLFPLALAAWCVLLIGRATHAEPPVSLPRPAATQPATLYIVKTECVLYVTWNDGQTTRRTIESHVGH
jgi:hypothetical protein